MLVFACGQPVYSGDGPVRHCTRIPWWEPMRASTNPSQSPGAAGSGAGSWICSSFHSLQLSIPSWEKDAVWLKRKMRSCFPSSTEDIPASGNCQPWVLGWVFSIIPFPCISHSFFTHFDLFLMALTLLFIIINSSRVDTMRLFQVQVFLITLQREIDPSWAMEKPDEDPAAAVKYDFRVAAVQTAPDSDCFPALTPGQCF